MFSSSVFPVLLSGFLILSAKRPYTGLFAATIRLISPPLFKTISDSDVWTLTFDHDTLAAQDPRAADTIWWSLVSIFVLFLFLSFVQVINQSACFVTCFAFSPLLFLAVFSNALVSPLSREPAFAHV